MFSAIFANLATYDNLFYLNGTRGSERAIKTAQVKGLASWGRPIILEKTETST